MLELVVNTVSHGDVLAVLDGSRVWVPVAALEETGLHGFAGLRRTIGTVVFVGLDSLAPDIRYVFDESAIVLRLTAATPRLPVHAINLRGDRPAASPGGRAAPSAFLNYSVSAREAGTGLSAEAGVTAGGALLMTSVSRVAGGRFARGVTSVTYDQRSRLRRWVIGDAFASGGTLGGAALVGGLSVSTEYSLDPYFVSHSGVNLAGAATTPSTVDVYVDGRLVRTEALSPGQFELTGLPVTNGRGEARMVLRDAFGREQEVSVPYYITSSVLAKGLQQYSYTVGLRRDGPGAVGAGRYAAPAVFARHRLGITDAVTAGFRVEATRGRASGGPAVTMRLPRGQVEATLGASGGGQPAGLAAAVAYSFSGRAHSFGAAWQETSTHYTTIGLLPLHRRPRQQASGFAGLQINRAGSVNLQVGSTRFADDTRDVRASASAAVRLNARSLLTVTGTADRQGDTRRRRLGMSIAVSTYLGHNTSSVVSHDRDAAGSHTGVQLQRSLPAGSGYGYRALADGAQSGRALGVFQYQNAYGRYEVANEVRAGGSSPSASVAGALLAIGGRVYATRPVDNSFALVRVPGVADVRVYSSNQEVGRTDRHGDLVVPNLIAYYGNRLAISDQDVPMTHAVGRNDRTVAPPYRGGTVVLFPVERIQSLSGTVRLIEAGSAAVPAYGQLTLSAGGRQFESPVGRDGEFYFENVPAGRHPSILQYGGATCGFFIVVPVSQEPAVTLGRLTCERAEPKL